MKTQSLLWTLCLCLVSINAVAQEICQSLLEKAISTYQNGNGDLGKAFNYLQDLETCDIHNSLQEKRKKLQKAIFDAIKSQKKIAEDAKIEANVAEKQAIYLAERASREAKRANNAMDTLRKEQQKARENAIRDSLLILYFEADPSKLLPLEKIKYLENVVNACHKRYSKTLEFCHFELASLYEYIGKDTIGIDTKSPDSEALQKAEQYYTDLILLAGDGQKLNIYQQLSEFYKRSGNKGALARIEELIGKNIEDVFAFSLSQAEGKEITIRDSIYAVTFERVNSGVRFAGKITIRSAFQKDSVFFKKVLSPSNIQLLNLVADYLSPFDRINTSDDRVYISYGLAGWSLGEDRNKINDLPQLLILFKKNYPEAFKHYFGIYRLDVNIEGEYLTLDGTPLNLKNQKSVLRSPAWAFAFYRAAQDVRMQATQLLVMFRQFDYLLNNEITTAQVITSEYGRSLFVAEYLEKYSQEDKLFKSPVLVQSNDTIQLDNEKILAEANNLVAEKGKHFSSWTFDEERILLMKIKNIFESKLAKKILADTSFFSPKKRLLHSGDYCINLTDITNKVKELKSNLNVNTVRKFCVILDAAHGAIDFQGKHVTAPSKQFQHTKGTFHQGKWFYEGVFNRYVTYRVAQTLRKLGIQYLIVNHFFVDTPLVDRIEMANNLYDLGYQCIYISNHANASGLGEATGTEVYTTPGKDRSDKLADLYWKNFEKLLAKDITFRPDHSDGDPDREANFFVLKNTKMPAVMIEHGFIDNYEDALLLTNDRIIDLFVETQVRTILDYMKSLE